jgi:hypothetical protein
MPAPVNRNTPVPVLDEIQHLTVPSVRVQRPTVRKDYDWAFSPVFEVNRRAIFCCNCAHSFSPESNFCETKSSLVAQQSHPVAANHHIVLVAS